MVFRIRAPGLRISTRGVSVGPRILNVSAGRGGVRVSGGLGGFGGSIGTSGARFRSGIGPVSVSVGSGGPRISGGIGGVGISAGTKSLGVSLSPGPFWLGGRLTGGQGSAGSTQAIYRRVSLSNHYEEHKSQMARLGRQRRNKIEMAAAAVTAQIFEMRSMIAWAQPYSKIKRPIIPALPSRKEVHAAIKEEKKKLKSHRFWHSLSARSLSEEIDDRESKIINQRQLLQETCDHLFDEFTKLESEISILVLQAILADNGVPGAPVGIDNGDVLVLLSFPDADSLIWPEIANEVTDIQVKATVKRRTKGNIAELYKLILLRYLLATGKEVLCSNDQIKSVRVMAVDGSFAGNLSDQPVWGSITLGRDDLSKLSADTKYLELWDRFIGIWENSSSDFYLEEIEDCFDLASDLWLLLKEEESVRFPEFIERFEAVQSSKTRSLVDSGILSDYFNVSDFDSVEDSGGPLNVEDNVAITNFSVLDPYFWLDAQDLISAWRS